MISFVIKRYRQKIIFMTVAVGHDSQSTTRKYIMNWDRIEGNWKQLKGSVKHRWNKFSDDQLDAIAGKRDHLIGKIQELYSVSRDEAEKQLGIWQMRLKEMEHSN